MDKKWAVKVAYEFQGKKRNQTISRHSRYDLAVKAAKKTGFDSFLKIEEIENGN